MKFNALVLALSILQASCFQDQSQPHLIALEQVAETRFCKPTNDCSFERAGVDYTVFEGQVVTRASCSVTPPYEIKIDDADHTISSKILKGNHGYWNSSKIKSRELDGVRIFANENAYLELLISDSGNLCFKESLIYL